MSRYIPMPAYHDMMPVDISFVFEDEKPAGKHGFLKTDGENLRFEDGTLAKFWGVNFNGGACFPSKEYARQVARRLAQSGCNIVRFHQLDAEWDTPNIFAYSKGKRVYTTRQLDPKSMDALDYLVYCLKEEGIYCYLDMLTYRKFKEGDDVVTPELLIDAAKPWCMSNARLIELQKEYCTQLWTHYNPYTKLEYRNDPVFVLSEIANETGFFYNFHAKYRKPAPYYINEFRQMFRVWLEERGIEYDWENFDLMSFDEPVVLFKSEVTRNYYTEMYNHMRSIGVKIPITGDTMTNESYGAAMAQVDMSYMDSHHYHYDWKWQNNERTCMNLSLTSVPSVFAKLPRADFAGKPFFVSEWDMPWPNNYRAESPIYFAAVGALQNWSGFTIHTYSYSTHLDKMDVLGRELSSPVAGVPFREGIFSTWNDPAKFGLFYHSALMLRRSDVSPANKKVAVAPADITKHSDNAWSTALEQHKVALTLGEEIPEGYDCRILDTEKVPIADPNLIVSDNGQLWRDLKKKIGAVDTPRTKAVYGMIGSGSGKSGSVNKGTTAAISLNGLDISCSTDFGVIALSSLTNDPIEKSDNMLLSAIGRARNTAQNFDGEKMIDIGRAPIMAEVINAKISLKTEIGDKLKVWGVNAEGFYAGMLPTTYEDGILSFEIGDAENPACYYLIVKE